jgi:DNA-binding NarL/FixJ family response regulator
MTATKTSTARSGGAQGYLLKDMFFEGAEDAIRKVHAGARRLPAGSWLNDSRNE